MTKARILPCQYYEHVAIGCTALKTLVVGPAQIAARLTQTSFLAAQMEAAATLDISIATASKNTACPSKAWRRTFTCVSGFCWVKLIAAEWVVPAICTLGAYPISADMACLAPYFQDWIDCTGFTIYHTQNKGLSQVLHMTGRNKSPTYKPKDRLRSLGGVVGSRCPPGPAPPCTPSGPRSAPPGPSGANSVPIGRSSRVLCRGVSSTPAARPPHRAALLSPYTPYPEVSRPPPKNPDYTPQVWQKANQDKFDIATDALWDLLRDTPRGIADSVWQDFLS